MAKSFFRNIYKSGNSDPINYFSVEIYDVDISIINSLKRIIQSNIKIPGFLGEDHPSVTIVENNGPLHNEIITHRIGLIPIHFNENEVENFDSDDYSFELNVTNDTTTMLNVTTESFQVSKKDTALSKKEIQRLFPPNPYTNHFILITRLRPNEILHFKATAILNDAIYHAGFSSVSLCAFHYIQDPKLVAKLPDNATILDKERAYFRNEYGDPTAVKFELEIECGLTAKYLISKALEILMSKLDKILNEIIAQTSEYIKIEVPESNNGYLFIFNDENDTLGNFLQSSMHNYYIRSKNMTSQNKTLSYVGYVCPHPLDTTMHLNFVIKNKIIKSDSTDTDTEYTYSNNKAEYIEVLSEQCRRSLSYLQEIKTQWLLSL